MGGMPAAAAAAAAKRTGTPRKAHRAAMVRRGKIPTLQLVLREATRQAATTAAGATKAAATTKGSAELGATLESGEGIKATATATPPQLHPQSLLLTLPRISPLSRPPPSSSSRPTRSVRQGPRRLRQPPPPPRCVLESLGQLSRARERRRLPRPLDQFRARPRLEHPRRLLLLLPRPLPRLPQ